MIMITPPPTVKQNVNKPTVQKLLQLFEEERVSPSPETVFADSQIFEFVLSMNFKKTIMMTMKREKACPFLMQKN